MIGIRLRLLGSVVLVLCVGLSAGCGGESEGDIFANLRPYLASGPHADVLVRCVTIEFADESCTFEELPLLGMDSASPTVDDVMERLVVSHDWMALRFRQALEALDPDMLLLLRSVTAVVIDDDIRPAFYFRATGAIYIDPYFLWTTNAEKRTISRVEDFRSGFGDALRFEVFFRYVDDDDWAWESYSLEGREERGIAEAKLGLAAVLYHELAHAADYFPPGEIAGLVRSRTVLEASELPTYTQPTFQLLMLEPLSSTVLMGIADVRFGGETATSAQRTLTASQAADEFEPDGASDDYAYFSPREDLAMLFEETMMRRRFGFERDLGFIPAPSNPRGCESYIVDWGTRGRIGRPNVKARAAYVSSVILPEVDLDGFYDTLPEPEALRTGVDWCDSVVLDAPGTARAARAGHAEVDALRIWRERHHRWE